MRFAESAPSPACAGPAPGPRLRRLRVALGTWVAIEASAQSEATAADAIEAAYAALTEVERRMHPEREGSEVARINSAPLCVHTPIHASTWEVLRLAQRLNELTQGVFDPCLPSSPGRMSDLELSGASGDPRRGSRAARAWHSISEALQRASPSTVRSRPCARTAAMQAG